MPARIVAPAIAVLLAAGCVDEPSLLCDFERVVWSLDEVEIAPEHDVSDEAGIQIDVLLRTSLEPGVAVELEVSDAEGEVTASALEQVAGDGSVLFETVSLPLGEVTMEMRAHNGCRVIGSTRVVFVFDEMGRPECTLSLREPAVSREAFEIPVLNAAADADQETPEFEGRFSVATGRPDIEVRLLLVDVAGSAETALEQRSGEDRAAEFDVALGQGEHAVRALCRWELAGSPQSSTTRRYHVDTRPPGCELLAPDDAVTSADDLDGESQNGIQFELRGRATGGDVEGEEAAFDVEGQVFSGTPVDAAGESSAIGELPDPPPTPQELSFATADRAGNPCSVSVTF